jgi:hypothetical protein
MARHSLEDKKTISTIDTKRKNAIEKFFGLTEKVLRHIEWSIEATKVCVACSSTVDKEGHITHVPGKALDKDGKCAMCHGTNLVPDVQQRNWATVEIADRIAPKPKAVEMTVDKADERKDLEEEIKKLKDHDLDRQLIALGVVPVNEANAG